MRVIIIGGGIIGAACAYALRDHDLTLLDAGGGATDASFGWIGASFHLDAAHFRLRAEGIEAWARLCRDLDLPVERCGCLSWEDIDVQALRDLGYSVEEVDAARFAALEPAIAPAPAAALRFEVEMAADAAVTAQRLAQCARQIVGVRALAIETTAGRVTGVATAHGILPADAVVLAAGTGSALLLQGLGITLPMLPRPGLMLQTAPVDVRLNHICVAPDQELRQLPDGSLLAPTAASHQSDSNAAITERPDVLADAACARIGAMIGRDVQWTQLMRADRPMPGDERPVIGPVGPDGLHLAVMHSGVTLAAITAEIMAAEVTGKGMSNLHTDLVAPYRPSRFQSAIS
ncbi:MAG: FAD-dependent oxidoreductase [Pseudomonadota bacterium]